VLRTGPNHRFGLALVVAALTTGTIGSSGALSASGASSRSAGTAGAAAATSESDRPAPPSSDPAAVARSVAAAAHRVTPLAPAPAIPRTTEIVARRIELHPPDETGQRQAKASHGAVAIGLPWQPGSASAEHAQDGTVVYLDHSGKADLAVQELADGSVRVQTLMNNMQAPTEYRYPLSLSPGVRVHPASDGGYDIELAAGAPPVAHINPAWAIDAAGRPVPTRYDLDGNVLVQKIDHRRPGTKYPVVADPWFSINFGLAWHIARCAAAVAASVVTNVFVATKIARAGGVARAVARIVKAGTRTARLNAAKSIALEITGAGSVMSNCVNW